MSLRLKIVNWVLKTFERPRLSRLTDAHELHQRLLRQSRLFVEPAATYTTTTTLTYGTSDVPALVVSPKISQPRAALLYLHGGGYAVGSPQTHRKLAGRIALESQLETFLPEYRVSAATPFPAAYEDALVSYKALLERGYKRIAIAGDSAGGGLVFALLHGICDEALPKPFAVAGLCPWTDLTLSSPSLVENDRTEVMLPPDRMEETVAQYVGTHARNDPRVSPVFGSFTGAPPSLLQVSQAEILYDDTLRLADRLREFGADVRVQSWEQTFHVWHILQGWLPEADEAVHDLGRFLRLQLAKVTR